jgi:hypothetical protein
MTRPEVDRDELLYRLRWNWDHGRKETKHAIDAALADRQISRSTATWLHEQTKGWELDA